MFHKFFAWYEKYLTLNIAIAASLFTLQLIHLYWLTTNVVIFKLTGVSFWQLTDFWQVVIILVDYTEVPALITTSLVYINDLRKEYSLKPVLYLLFLNSQWLHIFWITDEFVVDQFTGAATGTVLPFWLAWVAIFIDYLELPVIFDTIKKLKEAIKDKSLKEARKAFEN